MVSDNLKRKNIYLEQPNFDILTLLQRKEQGKDRRRGLLVEAKQRAAGVFAEIISHIKHLTLFCFILAEIAEW